jgi:hypothetical protein
MKRILMLPAGVAFALTLAHPAPAQDGASQIVGIWKLQKFDRCVVGGSCSAVYGEKPPGYIVYSKSGVFLSQGYAVTRIAPKTPDPTDAERSALHKSMYAWGGTYTLDGNKVTVAVEFAWNESWKAVRPGHTVKVEGRTLSIESAPFKSPVDGAMVVNKLTLERVE